MSVGSGVARRARRSVYVSTARPQVPQGQAPGAVAGLRGGGPGMAAGARGGGGGRDAAAATATSVTGTEASALARTLGARGGGGETTGADARARGGGGGNDTAAATRFGAACSAAGWGTVAGEGAGRGGGGGSTVSGAATSTACTARGGGGGTHSTPALPLVARGGASALGAAGDGLTALPISIATSAAAALGSARGNTAEGRCTPAAGGIVISCFTAGGGTRTDAGRMVCGPKPGTEGGLSSGGAARTTPRSP